MPKTDKRKESRRVQEGSLVKIGSLKRGERSRFLSPLCMTSTDFAAEQGMSLALVRPLEIDFSWTVKTPRDLEDERSAYRSSLRELQRDLFLEQSSLNQELTDFQPSPFHFIMRWRDQNGKDHRHLCLDWETTATLFRQREQYGEENTLKHLRKLYCDEYLKKGVAFALGTVAARPQQWLLLGIIRLDWPVQSSFI